MSGTSLGKKLLRNYIRHTDIHNKLQEESEMWKRRGSEKHVFQTDTFRHRPASAPSGYMHCDRNEDSSSSWDRGGVRGRLTETHERGSRLSDRDEREARYWTRKLYEHEANDPDRWGHSGFKEQHPEEFKSHSGEESSGDENVRHKKKKCKSSREADRRKHPKKSSKRRKKRKKEKKKKSKEDDSDSDSSEGERSRSRSRKRKEGERKEVRKKSERGRRGERSSSEESGSEGEREKKSSSSRRRRKRHRRNSDTHQDTPRKTRKNWKAGDQEKSEDSDD